MKIGKIFLRTAFAAGFILIVALILLNTLPEVMSFSDGLSFYGIIVDIFAGIFTVWGLYWAATEFSESQVKPDLNLIIGTNHLYGVSPLLENEDQLQGQDNLRSGYVAPEVSQVILGVFLENKNPKAAQFVRITLRLVDAQAPSKFDIIEDSFHQYSPSINNISQKALFLQFGENLVVYQGDGVFLGNICIEWDKVKRPEKLTLEAGLYNLIGEPKTIVVSRPINWNEKV